MICILKFGRQFLSLCFCDDVTSFASDTFVYKNEFDTQFSLNIWSELLPEIPGLSSDAGATTVEIRILYLWHNFLVCGISTFAIMGSDNRRLHEDEDDGNEREEGVNVQPLDVLCMEQVLESMGADKFEPRVVAQLLEFVHRANTSYLLSVLQKLWSK